MGFENIRCRYDYEDNSDREEYTLNTTLHISSQRDDISLLRIFMHKIVVFLYGTVVLMLDVAKSFLRKPFEYITLTYLLGGLLYELLAHSKELISIFHDFSMEELGEFVVLVVLFATMLFWVEIIAKFKFLIVWIALAAGLLITHYIMQRKSSEPFPWTFWIWSIIVAILYGVYFIKGVIWNLYFSTSAQPFL